MEFKLLIENYKAIRIAELPINKGLNVLIGPNGSGKTCILSSLEFVRDLILHGAALAIARAGGPKQTFRRKHNKISFTLSFNYGERIYRMSKHPFEFKWKVTIAQSGPDKITSILNEKMEINVNVDESKIQLLKIEISQLKDKVKTKTFFCDSTEFGRDFFSIWDESFKTTNKSALGKSFKKRIMSIVHDFKKDRDRPFLPAMVRYDRRMRQIMSAFVDLNEYNILPDIARRATEQLHFAIMKPTGEGVSEVIHALENENYHKLIENNRSPYPYYGRGMYLSHSSYRHVYRYNDIYNNYYGYYMPTKGQLNRNLLYSAFENINKELTAAVNQINNVSTEIDPTSGKRFVVFRSRDTIFNPDEVSDGTMKWLCILVSIFVPHARTYLLEEPENFLHPWMQQRLVSMMRDQAKNNNTIFFLTTHSSTILNATHPSEILIITQSTKGTKISKLKNPDEIKMVLSDSNFGLGDLWVSGAINGVPSYE